jgi:hypothetical protein
MDKTEQRLKQDAELLSASVSRELRARIDASLEGVVPEGARPKRTDFDFSLWFAASLTGMAAAAVLVVVLMQRGADRVPAPADDAVATAVPEYAHELERQLPLQVRTADLAAPLEEELEDLKSDMEKARKSVEEDLDFTF